MTGSQRINFTEVREDGEGFDDSYWSLFPKRACQILRISFTTRHTRAQGFGDCVTTTFIPLLAASRRPCLASVQFCVGVRLGCAVQIDLLEHAMYVSLSLCLFLCSFFNTLRVLYNSKISPLQPCPGCPAHVMAHVPRFDLGHDFGLRSSNVESTTTLLILVNVSRIR